jgi:UDP-glucose:(heptosyl)LPS alpha-1,3-glucosyltransferase
VSATEVTIVGHDVGGIGGMERQLAELVTGLLERGVRVQVVSRTLRLEPHELLEWRRVRTPARPFVVAYPMFALVASWLVARKRSAVVHTTGAIVFNRADVCTLHYLHNGPGGKVRRSRRSSLAYRANAVLARRLSAWFERAVLQLPSRSRVVVAVSEALAEEVVAAFPGRRTSVRVVPNGVDRSRFRADAVARTTVRGTLGISDSDVVAVFVGSEWRSKGVDLAIDALELAPAVHLVVAGAGDLQALRSRARSRGVAGRVHLVGPTAAPERYYAAADVLVLPSGYESFSLAALEAAAAGLPVVSTPVGVARELIAGGGGIEVERTAASVGEALQDLAADARKRRTLGEAASRLAAAYDWDAVADAYVSIYAQASNGHASRQVIA